MKVGIIGGGFTGLAAALQLLKKGCQVTVLESQPYWGGLSSAFELLPGIYIERFYHHLFTNDYDILDLCRELGIYNKLLFLEGKTSILHKDRIYPFDSPLSVLKFSPLNIPERVRFGAVTALLRILNNNREFEKTAAVEWLERWYGRRAYKLIWEPLLVGKFDGYSREVIMSWFWARIKKRTAKLIYPEGGFQTIIGSLVERIGSLGGVLKSAIRVTKIMVNAEGCWEVTLNDCLIQTFDKLIVTTSLKSFLSFFLLLPEDYLKSLEKIKYLNAHVLILALSKPLTNYYWINVNDTSFPFLVVGEQSNLLGVDHYRGKSIVYLGNYLPDGDSRLSLSAPQLLHLYFHHLKRISPSFELSHVEKCISFVGSSAQPVVNRGYKDNIPTFKTPLENLYLATMAQVYPWDRGVNYAVKLGKDLVREILE